MTASHEERSGLSRILRDVATHTTATVSYCARDFRYLWVSEATAQMLGSTKPSMEGRAISTVIGKAAFDQLQPRMQHAVEGHAVRYVEHVNYARVGWRWIDASYVPASGVGGSIQGWVATVTDVSRLKALEDSLTSLKNESEAAFATFKHEVRNPLSAVQYGVDALKRTPHGSSRAHELLEVVHRQTRLLGRLVNDLLDSRQLGSGTVALQRVPIQRILHMGLDATRHLFESLGHEIQLAVPEREIYIHADADRLSQVFINLLQNGAEYTDSPGLMQVTCVASDASVGVSFKDNGIGIPQDELPHIFDLSARGSVSKQLRPHGLGMGLHMAKQIIELHHGTIRAQSDGAGKGAEFIVQLPLADEC